VPPNPARQPLSGDGDDSGTAGIGADFSPVRKSVLMCSVGIGSTTTLSPQRHRAIASTAKEAPAGMPLA